MAESGEALSAGDVQRLLRDPSPLARAGIARKVAGTLDRSSLDEAQRHHALAIVHALAADLAVEVRLALAETLKASPELPPEVALKLARDVEDVAVPILEMSTVLTDEDLVLLVREGEEWRQRSIALRPQVSAPVSAALIDHGTAPVVASLMGNPGAEISEAGLERALDRFGDDPAVQAPMAARSLPPRVVARLVPLLSDALGAQLVQTAALPEDMASELVLRSRDRALLTLVSEAPRVDLAASLADLNRSGRLSDRLVLRALLSGDITFFETALAVRAGVPLSNAQRLIHDPGRRGLAALCEKAGIEARLVPAMRVALGVVEETEFDGSPEDLERHRARVMERVLTQFDRFDTADLDFLLRRIEAGGAGLRR